MSANVSATELVDNLLAGRASFLARAIDQVVAPDDQQDVEKAIELLERLAAADLSDGAL